MILTTLSEGNGCLIISFHQNTKGFEDRTDVSVFFFPCEGEIVFHSVVASDAPNAHVSYWFDPEFEGPISDGELCSPLRVSGEGMTVNPVFIQELLVIHCEGFGRAIAPELAFFLLVPLYHFSVVGEGAVVVSAHGMRILMAWA